MDKKAFVENIALQFEDPKGFSFSTNFREQDDWSSLIALSVIAVIYKKYKVRLKGDDIRRTDTVEELYNLVMEKL